jgi:hypothetical protein
MRAVAAPMPLDAPVIKKVFMDEVLFCLLSRQPIIARQGIPWRWNRHAV